MAEQKLKNNFRLNKISTLHSYCDKCLFAGAKSFSEYCKSCVLLQDSETCHKLNKQIEELILKIK